ncbi:sperm mitochondrial-associated cysteine-rich protein-like [Polistes fuscatus]|uniref:sperm mitochondrial-associated cysteine-rich protein-like n=1 Tax=Polistes fuscatus TaxID=30207 RepID=UPI001CA93E02|nr:sperm mitochondrial-associated cysteine-rich protein-like [Polistes fuscatus]
MSCRSSCRKAWRTSTLPPPCCHIKPAPFCCPKDGCPPMQQQQCPPKRCFTPTICPPLVRLSLFFCSVLICRDRPCPPPPPPTICIAGPCSIRPCRIKYECPPPPKILPPPSCTRFCINYTCDGSTYAPCYYSNLPKCSRVDCC